MEGNLGARQRAREKGGGESAKNPLSLPFRTPATQDTKPAVTRVVWNLPSQHPQENSTTEWQIYSKVNHYYCLFVLSINYFNTANEGKEKKLKSRWHCTSSTTGSSSDLSWFNYFLSSWLSLSASNSILAASGRCRNNGLRRTFKSSSILAMEFLISLYLLTSKDFLLENLWKNSRNCLSRASG